MTEEAFIIDAVRSPRGKGKPTGGIVIDDIDLFEVNEAFASVVLRFFRETGADPERVNVNGGPWPSGIRSAPPAAC